MSEKVSIIITYNGEKDYLNLLLQSIKLCSRENEYEIIIVNNNKKNLDPILEDNIKVIFSKDNVTYKESLLKGLKNISEDSGYLVFSHCDNVILNNKWLDFLISSDINNEECGALSVGIPFKFIGPSGKEIIGPYYNFLFTNRKLFDNLNGFRYLSCDNVGLFLGYQHQLQEIDKKIIMVNPLGFLHHFSLKSIDEKLKLRDVEEFNKNFIDRINKY